MIKKVILFILLCYAPFALANSNVAWILDIQDAIGPATADYVTRGIEEANQAGIALIILRIDTPGGLDKSMRQIVQAIIASPIPIVSYVNPSGARAASAGTYILYASHVAAMSPGTNLGAATPVQMSSIASFNPLDLGGLASQEEKEDKEMAGENQEKTEDKEVNDVPENPMKNKMINDAEAYLRSLAQMHGRNVEWATKAVRKSASLSAEEALEKNVIDLIASDIDDLLQQIKGRKVNLQGEETPLPMQTLIPKKIEPDWRTEFLLIITNPNIAYILMLLGIYGLIFEFANPGSVVPGVVGGICLLLALFSLQLLPVNYAGVALILLGIAFISAEAFIPSFGILGIGGIISLAIGSIMLIDTDLPQFSISYSLIITLSIVTALFILLILQGLFKIHWQKVVSGQEGLIGAEGECIAQEGNHLKVYVQSEIWNATSSEPIAVGEAVKVLEVKGLKLKVAPLSPVKNKILEG